MWNDVAIWILDTIGNRERSRQRPKEAVRAFQVELAIWDELALQCKDEEFRGRSVHRYQSEVLQKIRMLRGQTGDTVEPLMLREKPEELQGLIARGAALLDAARLEREVGETVSGKTRAALSEACRRLARTPPTAASGLYDLARMYSVLSAPGPLDKAVPVDQSRKGQNEAAAQAIALLHRAVAAGWSDVDRMNHDPDLDSLRERPDFQALLRELAFPADPFARCRSLEP